MGINTIEATNSLVAEFQIKAEQSLENGAEAFVDLARHLKDVSCTEMTKVEMFYNAQNALSDELSASQKHAIEFAKRDFGFQK